MRMWGTEGGAGHPCDAAAAVQKAHRAERGCHLLCLSGVASSHREQRRVRHGCAAVSHAHKRWPFAVADPGFLRSAHAHERSRARFLCRLCRHRAVDTSHLISLSAPKRTKKQGARLLFSLLCPGLLMPVGAQSACSMSAACQIRSFSSATLWSVAPSSVSMASSTSSTVW